MMTHELAEKLRLAPNVPVGVIGFGIQGLVAHDEDDYIEVQDIVLGDVWCLRDRWRTIKGVQIKHTMDDITE